MASQLVSVPGPQRRRLLPREFGWLYLVGPIATAPILLDQMFERPVSEMLRGLAAVAIPFVLLLVAFQLLYSRVLPPVVERIRGERRLWAFHAVVTTAVPVVMAPLIIPLQMLAKAKSIPFVQALVPLVAVSWVLVIPSLVLQRLRARAQLGEARAAAAERAALVSQLEALQARANPHFFFNSMNTIADLITIDPELAERTVERLAKLMRYSLNAARTPTVPFRCELEVVRDYLAIQAARFGDRLDVSLEVDPSALEIPVPPLFLQPLVENAVVHGLNDRVRGRVQITVSRRDDCVEFVVSDDGPGPGRSTQHGSQTALRDLRDRVALLYGDRGRFAIGDRDGGGFQVRIGIPAPCA